LATLLAISLFFCWTFVGYSFFIIFNSPLGQLQKLLLSPSLGVCIYIIPIFILNKFNIPVDNIALPILISTLFIATIIQLKKGVIYKNKYIGILLLIIFFNSITLGLPLIGHGFNWVSVLNDDMTNYSLGALRFLHNGYYSLPDAKILGGGEDYSLSVWWLHTPRGVRAGSELMLAAIWSITGLNAHKLFMPLILALQMMQIASIAALSTKSNGNLKIAFWTIAALSFSALMGLGVLWQLLGQVGGIGLLAALLALIATNITIKRKADLNTGAIRQILPKVVIFVGTAIWYPEVFPIFGLAWCLFSASLLATRKICTSRGLLIEAIVIGFCAALILGESSISGFRFILEQIQNGTSSENWSAAIFPYFLIPSGIAAFWGLIPLAGIPSEPFGTYAIISGAVLSAISLAVLISYAWRKKSLFFSIICAMLIVGVVLITKKSGFGLFKLALFIQPFLIGWAVSSLLELKNLYARRISQVLLFILIVVNALTLKNYIDGAGGIGTSSEKQNYLNLSSSQISSEFEKFIKSSPHLNCKNVALISETSSRTLAKIEALHTRGIPTFFLSNDYFLDIYDAEGLNKNDLKILDGSQQYTTESIGDHKIKLLNMGLLKGKSIYYLYDVNKFDVLNSFNNVVTDNKNIFRLTRDPVNRLVFIPSTTGSSYWSLDRDNIGLNPIENDPLFPGRRFSAIGSLLFLQAINPTKESRLVLEITNTLTDQFKRTLPTPSINGEILKFTGRGSGRIFSKPLNYDNVNGAAILSLDLGRKGKLFEFKKTPIMQIFGEELPYDGRHLTTFARDISIVSNETYLKRTPPSSINKFPENLGNRDLEYSGIYEDGWISESAFLTLASKKTTRLFEISGMIPKMHPNNDGSELKITIDGSIQLVKPLQSGEFITTLPARLKPGTHKIELSFSSPRAISSSDNRIVAAKIHFIGFRD